MSRERKTFDEFQLFANYGQGWELETTEETRPLIRQRLREYMENAPQYSYRTKKCRVKKGVK